VREGGTTIVVREETVIRRQLAKTQGLLDKYRPVKQWGTGATTAHCMLAQEIVVLEWVLGRDHEGWEQ